MNPDIPPDMGGTVSASGVRYLPDGHRTFTPGHTASLTHGAYSDRLVGPLALDMADELAVMVQGTPAEGPSFIAARSALALRLARLRLVVDYINATHGGLPINPETGEPLPCSRLEGELLNGVDRALDALGLTPASAAKLGVDLIRGGSLAVEMAAAIAARDRADKRMSAEPDGVTP